MRGVLLLRLACGLADSQNGNLRSLEVLPGGAVAEAPQAQLTTLAHRLNADIYGARRAEPRTGLRVLYVVASQAKESGLDVALQSVLLEHGMEVREIGAPGLCVNKPCGPGLYAKQDGPSGVELVAQACGEQPADGIVMTQGLNDLKKQNGLGSNLGPDLQKFLASAKSACGESVKVVLVEPPLGGLDQDGGRDQEWPQAELHAIQSNEAAAYAEAAQDPSVTLIDGNALANHTDFDRVAHFCTDKRDCETSQKLAGAIVDAVSAIAAQATPSSLADELALVLEKPLAAAEAEAKSVTERFEAGLSNTGDASEHLHKVYVVLSVLPFTIVLAILLRGPPEVEAPEPRARGPRLDWVNGLRVFATAWILIGHFIKSPNADEPLSTLWSHGFVPVQVYIILSGFITHYAYSSKTDFWDFYAVRFGAIILSYYVTQLLELAVQYGKVRENIIAGIPLAITLTQAWVPGMFWQFVNGPAWTLSTLAFCWWLYPDVRRLLRTSMPKLQGLLVLCHVVPLLPVLLITFAGHWAVDESTFTFLYKAPLLRLFDFVGGACLAEMLLRGCGTSRAWGPVSDLAAVALVAYAGIVPASRSGFFGGLMLTSPQVLIGLLLFGASASVSSGRGLLVRLFEQPVFAQLGEHTFQVYIWQMTVAELFKIFSTNQVHVALWDRKVQTQNLVLPFFVALWLWASVWAVYVDGPFRDFVRSKVRGEAAKPRAGPEAASSPS